MRNSRWRSLPLLLSVGLLAMGCRDDSAHARSLDPSPPRERTEVITQVLQTTPAAEITYSTAKRISSDPSGESMPVGNLPGWRQTAIDDFSVPVPLGSFPTAVAERWTAYPSPWKDTAKRGAYSPLRVVEVDNGVLTKHIRTEQGVPLVAAILPRLAAGTGSSGLTYGRFAVRFRSDPLPGYTIAWLLWPDSETWPRDGEIDFPEMGLDSPRVGGYVHHEGATSGQDQTAFLTPADITHWHTAIIEWSPGLVVFQLDGVEVGRATHRVPSTAMHWVLQTETRFGAVEPPAADVAGAVQIDWVAAWAYDPTVS